MRVNNMMPYDVYKYIRNRPLGRPQIEVTGGLLTILQEFDDPKGNELAESVLASVSGILAVSCDNPVGLGLLVGAGQGHNQTVVVYNAASFGFKPEWLSWMENLASLRPYVIVYSTPDTTQEFIQWSQSTPLDSFVCHRQDVAQHVIDIFEQSNHLE